MIDLDRIGAMVAETAAAEILPRYRNLGTEDTLNKTSAEDLVTVADRAAEVMLAGLLRAAWPDAAVVGEEAAFADPAVLDRIADAETCFIIDPIDGTWNFAHGLPSFGVMLAVTSRGETTHGLIADPLGGDYICAERGGGAWRVAPDGTRTRLKTAAPATIDQMSGFVGLGLFPRPLRDDLSARLNDFVRVLSIRASAFEYRAICQGSMHFSLNAQLKAWDHAAGQLIHAEAGGYSALIDGTAYAPTLRKGRLLLAPDRDSWQAICDRIGPAFDGDTG